MKVARSSSRKRATFMPPSSTKFHSGSDTWSLRHGWYLFIFEDERLECFLCSLDPLLSCTPASKIDRMIERPGRRPRQVQGKRAVLSQSAIQLLPREHKETQENGPNSQGDSDCPLPQHSKHKCDQEEGRPHYKGHTKGGRTLLAVDPGGSHHCPLFFCFWMYPVIVGARVAAMSMFIAVDRLPRKIGHVLFCDDRC